MKTIVMAALAVALGLGGAADGFAADPDRARDAKDRQAWKADAGSLDSKHVIGMKVRTPDGKNVGDVDQLIMNAKDGKVTHAVIGLGGLAGVGEKKVVVPWSQLKVARDDKNRDHMIATIESSALDRAPRYEAAADRDRERPAAASPATTDRDRDGVRDRSDKAPENPKKY
jgi:sporulation protein YlmC with PRC-barrel domain